MPFEVRDPRELVGLKPGDKVDFQLHVTATAGWADHFVVVTNTATAGAPAPPPAPEPAVGPLSPGDLVPDYPLTNQLGRAFQLGEFRGHAVALDFIFTRCPYPTFCPLLSRNFAAAQKRLAADPGLANCRLLSISFDPAHDTPERLRDYGVAYHQDPGLWTLATGELPVLVRLAGHFGLYFSANAEPAAQNHNLRTVVLDPKGRVARVFIGNEWSPDELVEELRKASEPSR